MDNFSIDVTGEGKTNLFRALEIAFSGRNGASHYAVRPVDEGRPLRLVFYWSASENAKDVLALPFKLDATGALEWASRWLAEAEYGREPDHDGDNEKGWRVWNEAWGHVDDHWGAFVAISPAWAMYGK